MSEQKTVNYGEIHAYMLKKTQEYYVNPPQILVDAVLAEARSRGEELTAQEAKKQVSLIDIQRLIKAEMKEKWPEFMASIPSNSLQDR